MIGPGSVLVGRCEARVGQEQSEVPALSAPARVSHPSHTQFTLCQEMSIVAERGNGNNTQISTTPGCMIVSILMLMDLFHVGKRKHSSICRS